MCKNCVDKHFCESVFSESAIVKKTTGMIADLCDETDVVSYELAYAIFASYGMDVYLKGGKEAALIETMLLHGGCFEKNMKMQFKKKTLS